MRVRGILIVFVAMINFTIAFASSNYGHRLGGGSGEFHNDLPENSLVALKASITGEGSKKKLDFPLQFHQKFRYFEFDIRETADGHLVLFHDEDFSRLLKYNEINKLAFNKILKSSELKEIFGKEKPKFKHLKIRYLTLAQLKTLYLEDSKKYTVPTLEEVLSQMKKMRIQKPITVEIKHLKSDLARRRLINIVAEFRDSYAIFEDLIFEEGYDFSGTGVNFMSFKKNFKASFSSSNFPLDYWCDEFKIHGFEKVYMPRFHSVNVCKPENL